MNPVNAIGIEHDSVYFSSYVSGLRKDTPFDKLSYEGYPSICGIISNECVFPPVNFGLCSRGISPIEFKRHRFETHHADSPWRDDLTRSLYGRKGTIHRDTDLYGGEMPISMLSNENAFDNCVSSMRCESQDRLWVYPHKGQKEIPRQYLPLTRHGNSDVIPRSRWFGHDGFERLNRDIVRIPHDGGLSVSKGRLHVPLSRRGKNNLVVKCGNLTVVISVPTVWKVYATVRGYSHFVLGYINDNGRPALGLQLGPCWQTEAPEKNCEHNKIPGPFHLMLMDNSASFAVLDDSSQLLIVEDTQVYLSWDEKSWYQVLTPPKR